MESTSYFARCFYKTIDAFSGCLYPQPVKFSRFPLGKLSGNEISRTIKIHLEIEMRMINASFGNRYPIHFDIAERASLNSTGAWVVYSPPADSHNQPVTSRGAACASPRRRARRGAKRSGEYDARTWQANRARAFRRPIAFLQNHDGLRSVPAYGGRATGD